MCKCVAATPESCLATRHAVSLNMVRLLGGCTCPCHFDERGAHLPVSVWHHNKRRQANRRVVFVKDGEKSR